MMVGILRNVFEECLFVSFVLVFSTCFFLLLINSLMDDLSMEKYFN